MKIGVGFFGFVVAALLGGCAPPAYYGYGQYPMASPQAQYAPQQVAPVLVGCRPTYVPVWNGCAYPMYQPMYTGGYYGAPMYYGDPLFRFNFNFGGGGKKHHGGGRHYRGR